jgi:hypothetical protein
MSPDTAPFVRTIEATVPGATIAQVTDQAVTEAPFDATVTRCALVPEAAVTGDNTNTRTFTLVNKGQTGAGTTIVATLALTTGVNLVAFDEKLFTLSAVAGATSVVAGDVLQLNEVVAGSGLAHSGGRVVIDFTRA